MRFGLAGRAVISGHPHVPNPPVTVPGQVELLRLDESLVSASFLQGRAPQGKLLELVMLTHCLHSWFPKLVEACDHSVPATVRTF